MSNWHYEFTVDEQVMMAHYEVVEEAEKHVKDVLKACYKFHDSEFNCAINSHILNIREDTRDCTFKFVEINISHGATDYGEGMTIYDTTYHSLADAEKWVNQFRTNDHQDFTGLSRALEALSELEEA